MEGNAKVDAKSKRAMIVLHCSSEYIAFKELDLEMIKANILTKIHDYYINIHMC